MFDVLVVSVQAFGCVLQAMLRENISGDIAKEELVLPFHGSFQHNLMVIYSNLTFWLTGSRYCVLTRCNAVRVNLNF